MWSCDHVFFCFIPTSQDPESHHPTATIRSVSDLHIPNKFFLVCEFKIQKTAPPLWLLEHLYWELITTYGWAELINSWAFCAHHWGQGCTTGHPWTWLSSQSHKITTIQTFESPRLCHRCHIEEQINLKSLSTVSEIQASAKHHGLNIRLANELLLPTVAPHASACVSTWLVCHCHWPYHIDRSEDLDKVQRTALFISDAM